MVARTSASVFRGCRTDRAGRRRLGDRPRRPASADSSGRTARPARAGRPHRLVETIRRLGRQPARPPYQSTTRVGSGMPPAGRIGCGIGSPVEGSSTRNAAGNGRGTGLERLDCRPRLLRLETGPAVPEVRRPSRSAFGPSSNQARQQSGSAATARRNRRSASGNSRLRSTPRRSGSAGRRCTDQSAAGRGTSGPPGRHNPGWRAWSPRRWCQTAELVVAARRRSQSFFSVAVDSAICSVGFGGSIDARRIGRCRRSGIGSPADRAADRRAARRAVVSLGVAAGSAAGPAGPGPASGPVKRAMTSEVRTIRMDGPP